MRSYVSCCPLSTSGVLARYGTVRTLVLCLLSVLFLGAAEPSSAVADEDPPRPSVGLVLSGGGARGAAHAGVLKILEELRIPIDCIAGTSMGAVVGGLYACGLSPQEIDANLRDIDWDDVFDDTPPRQRLPFRRKEMGYQALFDLELGLGPRGFEFPAGLVAGQKLDYLLEEMTVHSTRVGSFDELPVPFRAVATNLNTGERIVLRRGSLAEAMRMSMAVPGAFTPVTHDGMTLVDGGLVSNLPVDLVRSMGADVVIAVDILPRVGTADGPLPAVDILPQSFYLLMDRIAAHQDEFFGPDDVVIVPDLGDMTPVDFRMVPSAIDAGTESARLVNRELERLSVSEEDYGAFLEQQRRSATPVPSGTIGDIRVVGASRVDSRIIKGAIRAEAGAPLRLDVIREDIERVYALGDFERVGFHLTTTGVGQTLVIDVKEKSWGPNFIRAGLRAEADFTGRSDFTVLASLLTTRVNPYGGEWRTDLRFGAENGISTELHQPLGFSGLFFVSPKLGLGERRMEVFSDRPPDEELHVAVLDGGVDAGIQLRNHGEIRVGAVVGKRTATTRHGDVTEQSAIGGYSASVTLDRLDNLNFPRSGSFANLDGQFVSKDLGSDVSYDKTAITACAAISRGNHALAAIVEGGTSLGSVPPIHEQFELGGFLSLSGYERGQFLGPYFALAEVVYHYRLLRLPRPFGTGIYVGASLEAGNVWGSAGDVAAADLRYAGSVFVGSDSLLGPLYLGAGLTEHGGSSIYITLGTSLVRN